MSMAIDGSNGLTFPDASTQANSVSVSGIGGSAQSWQNVGSSPGRSYGTTYTNSTGRPIMVAIQDSVTGGSGCSITINGTSVTGQSFSASAAGGGGLSTYAIIPNNATYSASGNSPTRWFELR